MDKRKEPKFKDLKFRKLNKGIEVNGDKQEVFAANAGDFSVFHIKGKLYGNLRSTYVLRKNKKQIIDEFPRDLFLEKMKEKGLVFEWLEYGKRVEIKKQ